MVVKRADLSCCCRQGLSIVVCWHSCWLLALALLGLAAADDVRWCQRREPALQCTQRSAQQQQRSTAGLKTDDHREDPRLATRHQVPVFNAGEGGAFSPALFEEATRADSSTLVTSEYSLPLQRHQCMWAALKCDDHESMTPMTRFYPASDVGMRACMDVSTCPLMHRANSLKPAWEAAEGFSVNRLDWTYTVNASIVEECHRKGLKVMTSMNANLPDNGHTLGKSSATFMIGRVENIDGQLLTAPWMRGGKVQPYWGCVNKPEYRAVSLDYVDQALKTRPDGMQIDDPELNGGAMTWDHGDPRGSGCYCSHCMANFTAALTHTLNASERTRLNVSSGFNYKTFLKSGVANNSLAAASLRNLFEEFQINSSISWLQELRAYIHQSAVKLGLPQPFAFSGNNDGIWPRAYSMLDFGLGELSEHSATPAGLTEILRTGVPPGKQQVITMPKFHNFTVAHSAAGVQKIRWTIAYAYSIGGNVLAPWDNYLPDTGQGQYYGNMFTGRYYGNSSLFDDLYTFIRANTMLFDGAVRLDDPLQAGFVRVHSGKTGDHYRWQYPTEKGYSGVGTMHNVVDTTLAKCQAACYGAAWCIGIFFGGDSGKCAILRKLVPAFTTAIGDSYTYNMTLEGFVRVHSGKTGDHYRWRLPTEKGYIGVGTMHNVVDNTLTKCQAACYETAWCIGIFFGEDGRCAILRKLVPTSTTLLCDSYTYNRNNTDGSRPRLLAKTEVTEMSLLARRTVSNGIVVHIVDWRYGNGSLTAVHAPVAITLNNRRIAGNSTQCGAFQVHHGGPGRVLTPITSTSCVNGETVVTVESPRPWSVLLLRNHTDNDSRANKFPTSPDRTS